MIDPFHLEAYGKTAVNYNRDIEVFPIVRTILERITGSNDVYQSPTDMGVNMAGYGIVDDEAVRSAAKQEIIRRYYKAVCEQKQGRESIDTANRVELIMKQVSLSAEDRPVVASANDKYKASGVPSVAIALTDGRIITGKESKLMTAGAAAVLNCIKELAGLPDELRLISPYVLEPIISLKGDLFRLSHTVLNMEEVMIALAAVSYTHLLRHLFCTRVYLTAKPETRPRKR